MTTTEKKELTFTQHTNLQTAGAVDDGPLEEVQGSLLVAAQRVTQYEDNYTMRGNNIISIYPAIYNGKRSWLMKEVWNAADGYCASGIQETILPFAKGVEILLTRGVFHFEIPDKTKKIDPVWYREYPTLSQRGAVNAEPECQVKGILLIGEKPVLKYEDNESEYGNNIISIYPAIYNGKRSWLKVEKWEPALGYSASGTQETIIPFAKGTKLFYKAFNFPIPQ